METDSSDTDCTILLVRADAGGVSEQRRLASFDGIAFDDPDCGNASQATLRSPSASSAWSPLSNAIASAAAVESGSPNSHPAEPKNHRDDVDGELRIQQEVPAAA